MNHLDTIKKAAASHLVLKIDYVEKDGTREGWRRVEPYSLSHDDGKMAIFAWDITKNGIRRFALDRIERVEVTGENFIPRFRVEIRWE